jgi:hypothetical protein
MIGPNKRNHDCNRVQENALALLSVELNDEDEQRVYAHLSNCQHCREEFRADRRVWHTLSTCPVVKAEPSFNRMLSLRLSLEEPSVPKPEQVDRVLPALESTESAVDFNYDLSRLAWAFASSTLQ